MDQMKYNSWEKDLSDAARALTQPHVIQIIQAHLISGTIYSIENRDDEILIQMDAKSGIDYIREDDTGLQGIAARVQWDNGRSEYPYNTFTIRSKRHTGAKTEMQKRLEQIAEGYMYPAFTLQAYFSNRDENELLSIAAIKTEVLYTLLQDKIELFQKKRSDNEFVALRWGDVSEHVRMWVGVT